jgi:hypothetical protein
VSKTREGARKRLVVLIMAVVCGVAFGSVGAAGTAKRAPVHRYFEVQVLGGGTLNSQEFCTEQKPCSGDGRLEAHALDWSWTAWALVVYTDHGRFGDLDLHLIGPRPRVSALFTEATTFSGLTPGCDAYFSTGGGRDYSKHLLATNFELEPVGERLTVDAGRPMDRHFSRCGKGTASVHGRDNSPAAWDGLDGPWNYVAVRAPTRHQLLFARRPIVIKGYVQSLGGEHATGGWMHTSCCGSSLFFVFRPFRGGKTNVFKEEKRFARLHPITSTGFNQFAP